MKPRKAPSLEGRRAPDFERELLARARAWIPSWSLEDGANDFGLALLKIAARFNSEVAERLDGAGEKMALGLLDWLGMPAAAARPARMPVVLKMAETAQDPVLARRPVKMQVDVEKATVTFETETDLQVIPGQLAAIVAADPATDRYFMPPPGISSLAPLEPLPTAWKLKNFAAPDSKMLQLDPGLGLAQDMLVEIASQQYRIVKTKDDLVTIDPPVPAGDGFNEGERVTKVAAFAPFDGARNLQEHILYIGDSELLNIEAAARIEVQGLTAAPAGVTWQYWGKADPEDPNDADARWRDLKPEDTVAGATAAPLILTKPKGAVETGQEPAEGRWIRARAEVSNRLVTTDGVTLRINPLLPDTEPEPIAKDDFAALLRPEVFVNSTSSPADYFYPLGREPRMFDTLYLGSEEAFSKVGATAWVRFKLGDSTFAALSALREGADAGRIIAGVSEDGALRVFDFDPQNGTLVPRRDLDPLQPPGSNGGSGAAIGLDPSSSWPLPIWLPPPGSTSPQFHIATWAGANVWIWDETNTENGAWREWGVVPADLQADTPISGLIYLPAGGGQASTLVALGNDKVLYKTPASGSAQWNKIQTTDGVGNDVAFTTIAPIFDASVAGSFPTAANLLVGVSTDQQLYVIEVDTGTCAALISGDVKSTIRPAAAIDGNGNLTAVAASDSASDLLGYKFVSPGPPSLDVLPSVDPIQAVSVSYAAGALHFMVATDSGGQSSLTDWSCSDQTGFTSEPFATDLPADFPNAKGAPLILDKHILIPGAESAVFVADFNLANRITQSADILPGLLLPASGAPPLLVGDTVMMLDAGTPATIKVDDNGTTSGAEILFPLTGELPPNGSPPVWAYRKSSVQQGTIDMTNPDEFKLIGGDNETAENMWLLIDGTPRYVVSIVDTTDPRTIEIDPPFPPGPPTAGKYIRPIATAGQPVSYLKLDVTNGAWDADLLKRAPIRLGNPPTDTVWARAFTTDGANHPRLVLLDQALAPSPGERFLIDAAAGGWRRVFGDTAANPELVWEYWDGASWLRLPDVDDETNNLRNTGTLSFPVPDDIEAVEWAGKTSNWIRARLIGGDYGQETVVVETVDKGGGKTEQTVKRTTEGVRPPYAIHVGVAYALNEAVVPALVYTRDSGALRDQSDANRTAGANIEVFAPLSAALERLGAPALAAEGTEDCVPDCECKNGTPSTSPMPQPDQAPADNPSPPSTGGRRALYLGFTAKLSGGPVKVLFLAEKEGAYDSIAPLNVDALIGDRFTSIVAKDETRALGETGLLTMTFDAEPQRAGLFGQDLSWLRIAPSIASEDWKPAIAGAYLNGVWTQAAETMTRELLGSSDGQPNLTVTLARPPLLQNSLELRVKEPLGEEERDALIKQDPDLVKRDVLDLPGDWVLWKQVPDPADCGPRDRVYALDEETGTVRCGDGLHGMIPPAGPDSIVAFAYQRTEPVVDGVIAANLVRPRTDLNLVSPLESVETVVAADQSAGGVAPEKAEHVLQFAPARLRHRDRAVSARDFEDLVRQKSAEVLQARCLVRNGRIRLIVVVRGSDPAPSNAQQRELRRMLLEIAPPSLGAPGALEIAGPRVRHLRVQLDLGVATLDDSGGVAKEAKDHLVNFFSAKDGGDLGEGWPLGRAPREDDVAEALLDIPKLESIASIRLFELDELGAEQPWQRPVSPQDLVMLAPENVRIGFKILEAVA